MPADTPLDSSASDRSRGGLMATVRSHSTAIAIGLVAGAVLGYGISLFLPTEYTATSNVYLSATGPFNPGADDQGGDAVRFVADQGELALTTEVLTAAAALVQPPADVDEVRDNVTAVPSADASSFTITAIASTAEEAKAIADAVTVSYSNAAQTRVDVARDRALQAITVAPGAGAGAGEGEGGGLENQVALRAASYGNGVSTIEPALLPEAPSAPLSLQNALIGGLVGLFLVTGVFLLRDQRKARTASVADLDLMLGAPLLSRYPSPSGRAIGDLVNADAGSERFRAANDVLTAIDVRLEGIRRPSVLFLSWQNHLSTTALTVSVSLAAAREGRPVVLVDGGGKERGISSLTDVSPGRGLEGLANLATPVSASLRTWRVGKSELGVVPLSDWSPTPTSAAARPQVLRAAMERLRESSVLNLVDGPPLTERSLGLALGRGVDGVVLVLDEDTSVDDAQEMGRRIGLAGVSAIGYVLVRPQGRRGGRRGGEPAYVEGQVIEDDRAPASGRQRA